MTDSGERVLSYRSDPDPAVRGVNRVLYTITDLDGVPQDGLSLELVPWMPAHGHGTSVKPTVTAEGNGAYRIDNVVFYMPGSWQLRTRIVDLDDRVTPTFQIP